MFLTNTSSRTLRKQIVFSRILYCAWPTGLVEKVLDIIARSTMSALLSLNLGTLAVHAKTDDTFITTGFHEIVHCKSTLAITTNLTHCML